MLTKIHLLFIWIILLAATVLSYLMRFEESGATSVSHWAGAIIMLLATFKIGLIGFEFMEIRGSPWQLRAIFSAWAILVLSSVLGIYYGVIPPLATQ